MTVCAKILVTGYVQGVGYRYYTQDIAKVLNMTGWVKNGPAGVVEIYCEGEENNFNEFVEKLKQGPSWSQVKCVEVTEVGSEKKEDDFRITY